MPACIRCSAQWPISPLAIAPVSPACVGGAAPAGLGEGCVSTLSPLDPTPSPSASGSLHTDLTIQISLSPLVLCLGHCPTREVVISLKCLVSREQGSHANLGWHQRLPQGQSPGQLACSLSRQTLPTAAVSSPEVWVTGKDPETSVCWGALSRPRDPAGHGFLQRKLPLLEPRIPEPALGKIQ